MIPPGYFVYSTVQAFGMRRVAHRPVNGAAKARYVSKGMAAIDGDFVDLPLEQYRGAQGDNSTVIPRLH